MRTFVISQSMFAALASGGGGSDAVYELRRAKLNENLLLLRSLVRRAEPRSALDLAFTLLCEAQERAPEAVAGLLSHPWTGAWLAAASRRPVSGAVGEGDANRLSALAAVAMARTGERVEVELASDGGVAILPDTGALLVPGAERMPVRAVVGPDGVTAVDGTPLGEAGPADHSRWIPVRRVETVYDGSRLQVTLDDIDPARDCHRHRVAPRLDADEVRRWQGLLDDAWALLMRYAPDHAGEIAAGISVLVPLAPGPLRTGFSATSTDVFGGFALTRPASATALAVTLVHELQHSKLNVLLRMWPLHFRRLNTRYFAPWRKDARPLGGVLHGIFAFVGVAQLWRSLRASPDLGDIATHQFASMREQLRAAHRQVAHSDQLTEAGQTFMAGLDATITDMFSETVPKRYAVRARLDLGVTRAVWSVRNRSITGIVRPLA
jgi:HEXXH motif-containing protein